MIRQLTKASLVLGLTIGLIACSQLTNEKYQMLELGMDKKEVIGILGNAASCSETLGTENCIWGEEEGKNITVKFIGGKAIIFNKNGLDE
jgi:hypothetical protein